MRIMIVFLGLVFMFSDIAQAEKRGTREEAIAMVKRVQELFKAKGAEATFAAINKKDPKFKDRDLYAFANDLKEGIVVAHGVKRILVGKHYLELRDAEGVPLIKLMIKTALSKTGRGWVDYKWPDPVSGELTAKSAYIERLGDEYFVGVGIYKQ